jgi:ribosomal protein L7/L12
MTANRELTQNEIINLQEKIFACNEPSKIVEVELNNLMAMMQGGMHKIEAIKSYRTLTGAGLKEAKDAVERHWISKPYVENK